LGRRATQQIVYREIVPELPRYELLLVWQSGNRDSTLLNFRGVVSQLAESLNVGHRSAKPSHRAAHKS
jgi:hypothetical protein